MLKFKERAEVSKWTQSGADLASYPFGGVLHYL